MFVTHGMTLFDFWEGDGAETFEEGWRNKLIWGDNKLVMSSLLNQFAGRIDLIYIDPPFATGVDFSFSALVGEQGEELYKEQSIIEEKAYRDTWGREPEIYLRAMWERLTLARDLLAPNGSLYVHLDYRMDSYIRLILDDLFGPSCFRNSIAWCYASPGRNTERFKPCHDTLLYYSRSEAPIWNNPQQPLAEATLKVKSLKFRGQKEAWVRARDTKDMVDWWNINFPTGSGERLGYPTQKPEALIERVLNASSVPGSLVADFFIGSGTTAAVAERLGRRWIGCDLGRYAVHTTRKRMLGIPDCKPFEVLNLGKYERRYWQVATFGEDLDDDGVISLYEYIAFILKLYGASPASGMQHLHGKKGRAFVHVGAVDAPVTIDEIASCIEECLALKSKELHILGWEWEMGLHDPMADEAAARGVQLLLRQIPREVMEQQAAAKGDVGFFELAYLEVEVGDTGRKREMVVDLKNFVIPNPELVPDVVREKVRKWSDYVDYWAVDWNFSDDTFHQGWVTYRTRKDRSLALESDPHVYDGPGEYAVMVKVIDIFGNDTSKIVRVRVG